MKKAQANIEARKAEQAKIAAHKAYKFTWSVWKTFKDSGVIKLAFNGRCIGENDGVLTKWSYLPQGLALGASSEPFPLYYINDNA